MASDQYSKFPPEDPAGGTLVGVPRAGFGTPAAIASGDPGGTIAGLPPIALRPNAVRQPIPMAIPVASLSSDDPGATMVGLGRTLQPVPPAAAPPAPPQALPFLPGSRPGGAGPASRPMPNFGGLAMPMPPQPAMPDAGGTMVGMARVGAPRPPAMPVGDVGGTMVGMGRVAVPGPRPLAASDPGGTMVGMARVAPSAPGFGGHAGGFAPPAAAFAAPADEVGGTMVGMPVAAHAHGFAAAADVGSTMMGVPVAAAIGGAGSFAEPEPEAPPHPTGPPPAYEIIEHLGGGELGQVFHARHRENGADVALRIIRPDIAAVPGAIEALRDVVALAQDANHTHLGKQYELDESASPTLVMEYVPGKLLATLMSDRGSAPPNAVIDLGVRVCSALAAAHGIGLAHGRVHAGNVVLEAKTGRWVLLDVGHGYCVQGLEPAHDLYALGALLYEMGTTHSPFEAGDEPPDPRQYAPKIPAALSAILLRTLSPDSSLWFESAVELAQALAKAKGQT